MSESTHGDEALAPRCRSLWDAVEGRIADGIRRHRCEDLELRVVDAAGWPVPASLLRLRLRRHSFRFGANLFLVGHFAEAQQGARWAALFGADRAVHPGALFNAGTLPFYWRDLVPQEGHDRFSADAPAMHRRPPADAAVAFGLERELDLNGHCLAWDAPELSLPDWLPVEPGRRSAAMGSFIQELARRYGNHVRRWDVLNEPVRRWSNGRFAEVPMPPDYEAFAFSCAQASLPTDAVLMINEGGDTGGPWRRPFAEKYRGVIRDLRRRGARIATVGLQFHQFDLGGFAAGTAELDPVAVWDELDRYAELGLPLHISEVTMAQPQTGAAGEYIQAELTRRFYRLFHAHPAVQAITWWNCVDGTAWQQENHVLSGLLDADCRPKPVHAALDGLINREWAPVVDTQTDGSGCWRGRLPAGVWDVTVEAGRLRGGASATLAAGGGTVIVRLTDA